MDQGRSVGPAEVLVALRVNGEVRSLRVDPEATLLDALRERLALTGTKKGCDRGECGACTVHVDGRRTLACLTLALAHERSDVRTIEGVADGDVLHPVQEAFLAHDGLQCGFCTPGQVMSVLALLSPEEAGTPSHVTADLSAPPALAALSDAEIRERLSGNICRCAAYPGILAAVRSLLPGEG
jgi:xanthine dehydrogenase YagT iron-sulfur-binding subunit